MSHRSLTERACGRPVVIALEVRRFFCSGPGCARKIFAEQLEGLTRRHARRSSALRGNPLVLQCGEERLGHCVGVS
jgi:hypothetical protein